MVVAEQMQATVYHHMRPVGFQRFLLLFSFLFHDLAADDQVTQQRHLNSRWGFEGEREHVGRLIFPAVGQVKLMAFGFIHQTNRDF